MSKKFLAICVCLIVVVSGLGQTRSKSAKQRRPVKQPPEVVEAYRVCNEFQHVLADNFDFERAFEATFTKNPARRREVAIAEAEHGDGDLSQVDNDTVVGIYTSAAQLLILMMPLMFAGIDDNAELFPPQFEAMFERKPPNDPPTTPSLRRPTQARHTGFSRSCRKGRGKEFFRSQKHSRVQSALIKAG